MLKFLTIMTILVCIISGIRCCTRTSSRVKYVRPEVTRLPERDYQIVIPRKVSADGKFLSHKIPHHFKRSHYKNKNESNKSTNDAVHYRLTIEGIEHHLELYPNHQLLSPGAVLEKRRISKTKKSLDNVDLKKIHDTQCHYHGNAGNQNEKCALSTCYGLAGYIRTNTGWYMIEPVAGHDYQKNIEHPHIIYKRQPNKIDIIEKLCNVSENLSKSIKKRSMQFNKSKQIDNNKPYILELLIVLGKSLLDHHKDFDIENYTLTLVNMAAGLFRDPSLSLKILLVVVRIMRLEVENQEINLPVNKDAEMTLKHFQQWQKLINPGDDTHPNHHDCAILLTNIDICVDTKICGFTGVSSIASTCDPDKSGFVIKDNGLSTGYQIAHHLGHSLGMSHDNETENGCPGIYRTKSGYVETTIMYPGMHYVTKRWSKCSKYYIKQYIESGFGKCLYDTPGDHLVSSSDMLPGVMYNGDDQCRLLYHSDAHQCRNVINCKKLMCMVPSKGCISQNNSPADGTSCGEKKWCYEGECLTIGERLSTSVSFGPWSEWTPCSRTCGSGVASSTRKCNHATSKSSEYCRGNSVRHKICATEPCEIGSPSFRDVQCSEFNDWIFPEDGKVHQWVGYNLPENLRTSENPCVLYCLNEENLLTSLKPKVIDGTTCYRGIRDICVNGDCREIPCDLNLESDAVEDRCGVCRGDSTSCDIKEGIINVHTQSHFKKIIEAPVGSTNIRIEELSPTKSRIIVKSKNSKTQFIDGSHLGMFDVPGSKAWLGMIRASQESLNIPGPITESLSILVLPRENVTLKYSMGVKPDVHRKPEFTWDFIEWSRCNSPCGPGEKIAYPKCIEKIGGLVDDRHCIKLKKPDPKIQMCNQADCIPRWMIGEWQGCTPCTKNCMKYRSVTCIRPVGHGEQEADVIADDYCQGPKPKESEIGICRRRRAHKNLKSMKFNKNKILHHPRLYRESQNFNLNKKLKKKLKKNNNNEIFDNQDKPKNMNKKIEKNRIMIDKEDMKNFSLTIMIDHDENNNIINFPNDFSPQPVDNSTELILYGMDAIKYIEKIQKDTSAETSVENT